jgi:hypothetical protein
MSLTHDDLNTLKRFFPTQDHEFDWGKNCYITEYAITNRLEEVDPSWSFTDPAITTRAEHGEDGLTIVTAVLTMTVKGVSRTGVGRSNIELRKDGKREADQAEKAAATDALKRAARLFGVGRYLLTLDKKVRDYTSLETWLNQNKPKEKTWLHDEVQVANVKLNLESMIETYNESSVNQAKTDLDPRQFTNAKDYLDALHALVEGIYSSTPANISEPDFKPNPADGAAMEAMRQVAGDPPPTATEGEGEGEFKKALWTAVDFMYDNDNHKRASLKRRMATDATQHKVTIDMPIDKAVLEVMKHRALTDLFLDGGDYKKIFGMAIETYVAGNGLERTWQRFNAYFAEQQQPATPKAANG